MTQEKLDILAMRGLFWQKFYNRITLAEMQAEVKKIMDRQLNLMEVSE